MLRLLLTLLVTVATISYGQTDIAGAISSNTTWDASGNPYTISSNTVIMDGVTLTIDPGVTVLFTQDVYLRVLSGGTLIAQGTQTDSIYFTLTDTNSVTNTEGIEFADGAQGSVVVDDTTYSSGSLLDHCIFYGFITNGDGGALNIGNIELLINHCTFEGNIAHNGGAIHSVGYNSTKYFVNCNFDNNRAQDSGGAIKVIGGSSWSGTGTYKYIRSSFDNNSSNRGGVICGSTSGNYSNSGRHEIFACNFTNNTATTNGGVYYANSIGGGGFTASNSLFEQNTSNQGGVYWAHWGSNLFSFYNSTFIGNGSVEGGGVCYWSEDDQSRNLVIDGCKFINNYSINGASVIKMLEGRTGGDKSLTGSNNYFIGNKSYADNIEGQLLYNNDFGGSDGINLTSSLFIENGVDTTFSNNALIAGQFVGDNNTFLNNYTPYLLKYLPGGTSTITCENNFWGTKSAADIDSLIIDFNDDPGFNTPVADYTPFLTAPTDDLAGSPVTVTNISLRTDLSYSQPLSENIDPGDSLFIELSGVDSDSLSIGLSVVWIVNTMTQDTVTITAVESSENSATFRGIGFTGESTDDIYDVVEGQDGQVLKVISRMNPGQQQTIIVGDTPLPILSNFNISGEPDLTHALNHVPTFLWTYYDPLSTTQFSYQIQVSADSSFSTIDLWDSGVINSSDTNVVYGGIELIDGTSYHARLQVLNTNSIPSNYSELTFRMNSIPGEPILLTPYDEAILADNTPALFILNSSDSESDNLTYDFQLTSDWSFVNILDSANNVFNGTDSTSWQLGAPLADNIQYWWRARANDGFEYGEYSTPASFILNAENDDPAGFNLTSPLLDEAIISQSPLFTWDPAVDLDPLDTVRYVLYLDTPDPGVDTFHTGIDTSFQLTYNLDDNTGYHWKVVAYDLIESEAESNGGFQSFIINQGNDSPSIVELITPDSVMVLSLTPEMYWTPAFDADPGDIVSYEMHWWGDGIEYDSVLTDTNAAFVTSELEDNTQYFWEVLAMDQTDGISHSEEATFWTDLEPEAPGAFALVSPEDDVAGLSDMPVFEWESAEDPDPMDYATYTIQIATDSSFSGIAFEINTDLDVSYEMTEALTTDTEYWWRVIATDTDSLRTESEVFKFTVGYVAITDAVELPTEYVLQQNFPNPFNPSTTIRYGLPEDSNVSLVIYDLRGNVVQTLESGTKDAGWYELVWNGQTADGRTISTGLYFARIVAGDYSNVIKMLYLK